MIWDIICLVGIVVCVVVIFHYFKKLGVRNRERIDNILMMLVVIYEELKNEDNQRGNDTEK